MQLVRNHACNFIVIYNVHRVIDPIAGYVRVFLKSTERLIVR